MSSVLKLTVLLAVSGQIHQFASASDTGSGPTESTGNALTAPMSFAPFSIEQLQKAVTAAGGDELSELVEDDETSYYQGQFGDLTVMVTLDFVSEALSLQCESRIQGRLDERAFKRVNLWNQQQGIARAFLIESDAMGDSPTTIWMLSYDHKTGFDIPPASVRAFVKDFARSAAVLREYATGRREEVPTLEEIEDGIGGSHVVTFKSPHGNYAIEFPGKPAVRVMKIATPDGEIPEYHWEFSDDNAGQSFTAMYFDYPKDLIDKVGADAIVEAIRRQIVSDYQATLTELQPLTLKGSVGCQFGLSSSAGQRFALSRLFQVKNRLYRLTVHGIQDGHSDRAMKFLGSFKPASNSAQ
jgi:hypothetical protein